MRISAAILAGGRAMRLGGRDKAALVVDDRTFLECQLAAIAPITTDIVLVGRPAGAGGAGGATLRAVPDLLPGLGPLGGLHTAFEETHGDLLLLIACDMPYPSAAFLAYLASLARHADAVVPRTERGYHPLCAAYTRACRPAVTRRLAEGQLAMKDLLTDLRLRTVTTEEIDRFGGADRLLANVNTPAELRSLQACPGDERHER